MSLLSPEQLIRAWYDEVWVAGRVDLVGRLMAPDATLHGTGSTGAEIARPADFIAHFERMRGALSQLMVETVIVMASDTMAAARWRMRAFHDGDGLGVPPSRRPVEVSGLSICRAEFGRIVEAWYEWDRLPFALRIGAVGPR